MKGVVKITDLGISKLMKTSGLSTKIGTLFYLAPEIFHDEKYDEKSDIWSFGIMVLELLVGKRITELVKGMVSPSLIENFLS
jgi:serine/threonine protein kinase